MAFVLEAAEYRELLLPVAHYWIVATARAL